MNALGNFCFLTKDTNLDISDRLPEEYFPEIEQAHPGALASQWIPMVPELWRIENFRQFLEVRKSLLAAEVNHRMEELLHGDPRWLEGPSVTVPTTIAVGGGITSEEEEAQLETLNAWIEEHSLPRGELAYDFADPATGEQKAVFDLAWPSGLQEELSRELVALLLNEGADTIGIASQAGYRCFVFGPGVPSLRPRGNPGGGASNVSEACGREHDDSRSHIKTRRVRYNGGATTIWTAN